MGGKQIKPGGEPRQPEASLLEGMAAAVEKSVSLWESAAGFSEELEQRGKKRERAKNASIVQENVKRRSMLSSK